MLELKTIKPSTMKKRNFIKYIKYLIVLPITIVIICFLAWSLYLPIHM